MIIYLKRMELGREFEKVELASGLVGGLLC
jgi:hypothetical protein